MAISVNNREFISTSDPSPWIPLRAGENVIAVTSPLWGESTTVALEISDDGSDDTKSPMKRNGEAIVLTGNDRFIVDGPGLFRGVCANYSGSDPIKVSRVYPQN